MRFTSSSRHSSYHIHEASAPAAAAAAAVGTTETRQELTTTLAHPADADRAELVVLGIDDVRAAQTLVPGLLPLGHQGAIHKFLPSTNNSGRYNPWVVI